MSGSLADRLEFPQGSAVYPGRHEVVDALFHAADGTLVPVVVKKARIDARQRRLGRTRAERALSTARRLLAAGVDTPEPLESGTVGDESWYVARKLEGALQVRAWFGHRSAPRKFPAPPPEPSFEEVARRVGRLARSVHDAGIHFRDFTDGNVLVTGWPAEVRLWIVDLDRAVEKRRVGFLDRLRDLARPGLNTVADRDLLLEGYFGPSPSPAWAWLAVTLLRLRIRFWDDVKLRARPWRR